MVDTNSSKPVFVSCGGDDIVIWEEDTSEKKFSISKRCPMSGKTSDKHISLICWSDDNQLIGCVSSNEVWLINTSDLSLKDYINRKVLLEGQSSEGESTVISCICFMGSGSQILVGSSDGAVRLWDTEKSTIIKSFEGYGSPVSCITCRMKSSLLVAGLESGCIVFHNTSSTGTSPTVTLSTATETEEPVIERVNKVVISPFDHKLLASCGSSGYVRLWSTESHRLLTTFKQPHTKMANDVAFSPYNRKLMASVGGDGKICLYDIQQRKQLTQLTCHVGLCSLLLMKDGVTMVTGGMDGNVYFYNLKNCQKPEYIISGHKGVHVNSMAVQHVIKGGNGGHTSRKLPGKQVKKSSSKVTFKDVDHVLQLQTPSPVQNPTSFTTPMLSTTEETATSQKELSGIFSPLDVPYSSYVPKSTGQPSSGSSGIPSTDTPRLNHGTNGIPPTDSRPLPPSWPTPLPSHIQSTSISSVFSPLDSGHSNHPPIIPPSTTSTNGIPPHVIGTHVTGTHVTGTHVTGHSVSDTAITSSTTVNNKPKRTTSRSPVPKKPSSPRPKSTSPANTTIITSNKATTDSVSMSKLDSTSVIKEIPDDHDNYSTLMSTNIQSHLPSPDTRSTPLGSQQTVMTSSYTDPRVSSPPLATVTASHSVPSFVPSSATPTPGGVINPIQTQYLENLIKESQEETCSIIHRDIRNLSVSMIRQFSTLENQMVLALTAISERVDKATAEIQQLKHQVDHLTPKY